MNTRFFGLLQRLQNIITSLPFISIRVPFGLSNRPLAYFMLNFCLHRLLQNEECTSYKPCTRPIWKTTVVNNAQEIPDSRSSYILCYKSEITSFSQILKLKRCSNYKDAKLSRLNTEAF